MGNHNHYFDEHGVYTSSAPATPGTLPPDRALRIPPPAQDGFWPVVNETGDGWTLVENHRGEEGWLDGRLVEITDIGPLPDGWSAEPPAVPELSAEDKRRIAYQEEVDPLTSEARMRQDRARGFRLIGDEKRADEEEAKAEELFKAAAETWKAIRESLPATQSSS